MLVDIIINGVGSFSDCLKRKIKSQYVCMFVYVCMSDLMSATIYFIYLRKKFTR